MLNFKVYSIEKDPCWDGYQQIGMKKKGSKKVPNCVPETAKVLDYGSDEAVKAAKKKTPGQMEDDFLPHKMYDKYGNEYAAATKADHERMKKLGYSHDVNELGPAAMKRAKRRKASLDKAMKKYGDAEKMGMDPADVNQRRNKPTLKKR